MSFILDGLETETYDRTYSDRDLTRRIVGYFRPHRAAMVLVAGVLAISSFLDALAPIAVSWAIDLVATRSTTLFLALLGLALIGVGSLAWLFNFARQRVANRVVGDVVQDKTECVGLDEQGAGLRVDGCRNQATLLRP